MNGLHINLTEEERLIFNRNIENFISTCINSSTNRKNIFNKVIENLPSIPKRIIDGLDDISVKKSRISYVWITGLMLEEPAGNTKTDLKSEIILSCVVARLGKPFIAKGHRDGDMFLDLIPRKEDAGKELGTGTALEWHTDDAHLSSPPKFICLLGLRGAGDVKTIISKPYYEKLPEDVFRALSQPVFSIMPDESYSHGETVVQSIIQKKNDIFELRFDPKFTQSTIPEYQSMMSVLIQELEKNGKAFSVMNGELLIFNNRQLAHKRGNFKPQYVGKDRWVQRIMVS